MHIAADDGQNYESTPSQSCAIGPKSDCVKESHRQYFIWTTPYGQRFDRRSGDESGEPHNQFPYVPDNL
ncbi:hypothetical protein B0G71_1393 [Paraburkholderia sp. BL27I4N3]|nr:hypothetical protein B0G71_1393 [Paraburkholderia sp. BL27I4N3]